MESSPCCSWGAGSLLLDSIREERDIPYKIIRGSKGDLGHLFYFIACFRARDGGQKRKLYLTLENVRKRILEKLFSQ